MSRFWLLQALGWLPFLLLQVFLGADDQPVMSAGNLVSALSLTALAITGSVGLRVLYRAAQARGLGDLRWLGLLLLASLVMAFAVDALYYFGLWAFSGSGDVVAQLHAGQPPMARVPLLLVMYVLWSILYLALSRQQRLERAAHLEQSLQLALKEAQVQRLLGQLSPHFTFNAINNIRALILKDAEAARTQLGTFATLLRYQFTDADTALVTVAEELAVVADYLDLMRLQLGSRLQYEAEVEPAVLGRQVPKFALQLLVENAIKHGLEPSAKPGRLRVRARMEGTVLVLEVENSGRLAPPAADAGIGLQNLQQRLQLSFASAARFSLEQRGEYVLARITIESRP